MTGVPPRVSVIMPTYKHARFIRRAIESLLGQTLADWELIVVDDGSPDDTAERVRPYLADPRLAYHRLEENGGLGAALNFGLDRARGALIAYLPSDDVYYAEHLESLAATLANGAVLAFSGLRHTYNRTAPGEPPGEALQLVQVLHRRGPERWVERAELESDDLERLFWARLRPRGEFTGTGRVTCEWVDHPWQRHKLMREPIGGINFFRTYYQARHPLRYHTTAGNRMDEVEHYRRFRERPATPLASGGLKILLVGELAYNPDRVLALEERGHRLYGLWMPRPYWYNYVGPLPFGHVRDLSREDWEAEVRRLQPDVIYALLNWQAVPWCRHVLSRVRDIPSVWHFKEGPFICLEHGIWDDLVDLYALADGHIHTSPEMRDWFAAFLPPVAPERTLVLDGDLPKREWFSGPVTPRLSAADGEIHTVVPGRPIGLHPPDVAALARQGIHLHFYGDFTHGQWRAWIEKTQGLAPRHLHIHPHMDQAGWVAEFSRYDAGWLHFFQSENGGDLRRANWDDLNYPARMATLACAGLPMLQRANCGHLVATQALASEHGLGLAITALDELGPRLRDEAAMQRLREQVWRARPLFSFDHHADRLIDFFRRIIAARR
jgi:glycosyltransferase involved in cell wall biosynthesis